MRRLFAIIMAAFFSIAMALCTGCPKNLSLKDTPEEGEEQPDPGPEMPRP